MITSVAILEITTVKLSQILKDVLMLIFNCQHWVPIYQIFLNEITLKMSSLSKTTLLFFLLWEQKLISHRHSHQLSINFTLARRGQPNCFQCHLYVTIPYISIHTLFTSTKLLVIIWWRFYNNLLKTDSIGYTFGQFFTVVQ